eukprot:Rmarinus@m.19490
MRIRDRTFLYMMHACIALLLIGQVLFLIGFYRYMDTEEDDPKYTSYYLACIFNSLNIITAFVAIKRDTRWLNCFFLFLSLTSLVTSGGVINEQGHEVDIVDNVSNRCELYSWRHPFFCENIRLMFAGSFLYCFFLSVLLIMTFGLAGGSGAWRGQPVPLEDDDFGLADIDMTEFGMDTENLRRRVSCDD